MVREWPAYGDRLILWPRNSKTDDIATQRETFRRALRDVYRQGGWCVYLDEARYLTEFLGLSKLLELLWLQGRSLGVSVVSSTQRPRHLPLAAYSQASHLYVWHTRDEQDQKRLSQIAGGVPLRDIKAAMDSLPRHGVLYFNPDGEISTTKVDI